MCVGHSVRGWYMHATSRLKAEKIAALCRELRCTSSKSGLWWSSGRSAQKETALLSGPSWLCRSCWFWLPFCLARRRATSHKNPLSRSQGQDTNVILFRELVMEDLHFFRPFLPLDTADIMPYKTGISLIRTTGSSACLANAFWMCGL